MALAGKGKEDGAAKKLWVGATTFKVVALNPNLAGLRELGLNPKEDAVEPNYHIESNNSYRLDFWVRSTSKEVDKQILAKKTVFMKPEIYTSQAGNTEWIDKYGKHAWAKDKEDLELGNEKRPASKVIDVESAREAISGETDLSDFLFALLNIPKGTEAYLDNPLEIAKGNLEEVRAALADKPNNSVRLLIGVKDGIYQVIYPVYVRAWITNNDTFIYHLSKDTRNVDYYGEEPYNLREYNGEVNTPNNSNSEDNLPNIPTMVVEDDSFSDLPF